MIVLESGGVEGRGALELATQIGDSFRILRVGIGPHATSRGGSLRVPVDRGSAPALLLGVLHTLARDADASLVVIPGDLSLHRSHALWEAIDEALRTACSACSARTTVLLVAAKPPVLDVPPRWLVPLYWGGGRWPSVHTVFPATADAPRMTELGALADTGVLVAHAWTLASMLRDGGYGWFQALRQSVQHPEHVDNVFFTLESIDLFDDVLMPGLDHVRVVPARRHDTPSLVLVNPRATAPVGGENPEASCSAST